jgi:hypothetical protein
MLHINLIRFLLKVDSQTLAIVSKDGKKLIEHFPIDMCTFKLVEVIFLLFSALFSSCVTIIVIFLSLSLFVFVFVFSPALLPRSHANVPLALQLRRCAHACAVSCYGLCYPPSRIIGTSPAFPLTSSPPTRPNRSYGNPALAACATHHTTQNGNVIEAVCPGLRFEIRAKDVSDWFSALQRHASTINLRG